MKNFEELKRALGGRKLPFWRPDVAVMLTPVDDLEPIDRNDPESACTAIPLTLPSGFSPKAHACWDYFDDTAFLFTYKGRLVMTDESLYLTEHGNGTMEAPFGGPRGIFDSWEEVEAELEAIYDDLEAEGMLDD